MKVQQGLRLAHVCDQNWLSCTNAVMKLRGVSLQVAPLAALVQRLKLEVYSLKREEGEHGVLLGLLADLALKLREDAAISECLASLHHCATEGPDTLRVCRTPSFWGFGGFSHSLRNRPRPSPAGFPYKNKSLK
jgi:hypothetical protein